MSTSQVLDRTFYLYRRNFWLFAGIAMVAPALTTLAGLAQVWYFGIPVTPDPATANPEVMRVFFRDMMTRGVIGMTLGMVAYIVGYSIASGATVYAVSMLHLGKSTTIRQAYARIKPMFGRIIALVVRIFIIAGGPVVLAYAIMFGLVFFMSGKTRGGDPSIIMTAAFGVLLASLGAMGGVVWMVYAFCRYGLAVPACAIENLPVRFSMIRSKFLTRGSVGEVFLVYLLTGVIAFGVKAALQMPAYFRTGMFSMHGMHLSAGTMAWLYAAEFIGTMVAGPISTIARALVYYDQRVRKEAFDLQLMMEAISQAPELNGGTVMGATSTAG
jgi:hypothetical protein